MLSLSEFIARLPKTETHLHIEGAVTLDLLHEAFPGKHGATLPEWERDFRFHTFNEFQDFFMSVVFPYFNSAERYHRCAREAFARLQKQNVRYVETSFHAPNAFYCGETVGDVADAILSAVPNGLTVRLFGAISRNEYDRPGVAACFEELLTCDGVAGIDLHGYESLPLQEWTDSVWARFRAAGKATKAHAGEFGGHHAVKESIHRLGVRRIAHGVQAAEDAETLQLVKDTGTVLDVCPVSNVKLRVAPSLRQHQLRILMDAGVACTVNTDDPIAFGNTLNGEYEALATEAGFTRSELKHLARTGFEHGLLDRETKTALLDELETVPV
jgi:adenosine deaminase